MSLESVLNILFGSRMLNFVAWHLPLCPSISLICYSLFCFTCGDASAFVNLFLLKVALESALDVPFV